MGLFKEVRTQSSGNGISPAVPQAVQKQRAERKLPRRCLCFYCASQGAGHRRVSRARMELSVVVTSPVLSELEADMGILFPGSAWQHVCVPGGMEGWRQRAWGGGALVSPASPSFLPSRGSCCVVARVKPFCVSVSQRHSPVSRRCGCQTGP